MAFDGSYVNFIKYLTAELGKARMFDPATKKWSYNPDNRGKVVYDKLTKQESVVDYIGDIKDTHTAIKPPSAMHIIGLVTPLFCSWVEHPCLPSGSIWRRYHRRHC
jgi:hypothetical protein